jgi:small multidrug resistance pump
MMKYLPLIVATLLNATANVCIKLGMKRLPEGAGLMAALMSPALWVGLVCFGLSLVGYAAALRKLDISFAYPVMVGFGFVIVTTAAVFLFDEKLTLTRASGIGLILAGIIAATR